MTSTKRKARTLRLRRMNIVLKRLFPKAGIALVYSNPWELLVAVQLSAQCTDVMVNKVTKELFKKYSTLADYVNADQKEFEKDIYKTGFFRNKTKNILTAAKLVAKEYRGKIPETMEEILLIPGVARKTANVILGNAFEVVEGIAVDTHVRRFAIRFDLSDFRDPVRIERDLMTLLPKSEWFPFTYRIIEYGRKVCPARKHDCRNHPLTKIYPKAANSWPKAH